MSVKVRVTFNAHIVSVRNCAKWPPARTELIEYHKDIR